MTIYQVDAFTEQAFKGNPAGVMIVNESIPSELMQNIAMEMNLSETAFIMPAEDGFVIRYFTPTTEVPLCGHATLAGAHIVYQLGLKKAGDKIHFKAKGADLTICKDGGWIKMNFPQYPLNKIEIPAGFKEIVGFEPTEAYASSYEWILAVAKTEKEILETSPKFEEMKTKGLGHLIITSTCDTGQADVVVRCFAPTLGINEDPVTGSAHCALTPYWNMKSGLVEFDSLQLSKRTGRLKVKLLDGRVEIKGQAITVFRAELMI